MRNSYPATAARAEVSTPAFWVDLLEPTAEEITAVEREYGLRLPSRAQLDEIETSSRLRVEGKTLYLSMPATAPFKEPEGGPSPIGFVLTPDVLVTLRYIELHSFTRVGHELAGDPRCTDSAAAFTMLLEALVDTDADFLERISAQLVAISRQVFRPQGGQPTRVARANRLLREMLVGVGDAGESLSRIRESLTALQRLSGFTADTQGTWLHQDIQVRLKTVRQDVNSLTDFESHLSGKAQFLLDAVLGFINTEQNEIFKVLTIASVVGIPPTFIASLYGMNFHNMPELTWTWGYAYGLALIALSTILPIVWFKWRGWW
jgi:magnesium transporter